MLGWVVKFWGIDLGGRAGYNGFGVGDWLLAVDIGGTKVLAGVVSRRGEIKRWERVPTLAEKGGEVVAQQLLGLLRDLSKGDKIRAIGIACAGLIDGERGVVIDSPHLPWKGFPLKSRVEEALNIRAFLLNDASAAALGEYSFGAGRGVRHMLYVTVSTGIGGGLILDGKLYGGARGLAGEVGHITIESQGPPCECGNRGCWEALASGTAIAREARELIKSSPTSLLAKMAQEKDLTAELVHDAALKGDEIARTVIYRAGAYFGIGLAALINIFNPELLIIGGGVSLIGDMYLEPAFAEMRRRAYVLQGGPVRWCRPALEDKAALLGAVAYFNDLGLE